MIETRIMYLALLSKQNFDKIFKLVQFEDIQDPLIKKVMNFLKGYYQVMDLFKLEDCIDHLGIDDIKYIQLVLDKSIEPGNVEKEIQMNSMHFENEVINQKLIKVMNRRLFIKESDELSDLERDNQLKQLDVILAGLKEEQKQLMKALGR
jgi:hypothetical protein